MDKIETSAGITRTTPVGSTTIIPAHELNANDRSVRLSPSVGAVFRAAHEQSDVDVTADAMHHTLGNGSTQAAPGNDIRFAMPGDVKQTFMVGPVKGWVEFYGQTLNKSDYPSMFKALGITALTYVTPNLRGRVLVTQDTTQTEFNTLGEIGGAKTVTLTEAQMPSHIHTRALYPFNAFDSTGGSRSAGGDSTQVPASPVSTSYTGNAGSDQPHTNLQPYIVVRTLVKT